MILSEILGQIVKIVGHKFKTVDEEEFIAICNECLQEDLIDVLLLETKIKTNVPAGGEAMLPEDVYELTTLELDRGGEAKEIPLNDSYGRGYKRYEGNVTFQGYLLPDTMTVMYDRYPVSLTALDDEPDFPERFHHALKYFYLAYYYRTVVEDDETAGTYDKLYYKTREQIAKHQRKQRGIRATKKIKLHQWGV